MSTDLPPVAVRRGRAEPEEHAALTAALHGLLHEAAAPAGPGTAVAAAWRRTRRAALRTYR